MGGGGAPGVGPELGPELGRELGPELGRELGRELTSRVPSSVLRVDGASDGSSRVSSSVLRVDGASEGIRLGIRLGEALDRGVGEAVEGAPGVGAAVVGGRAVGAAVVGAPGVGAAVVGGRAVGAAVVGGRAVGAAVVGGRAVGAAVVGVPEVGRRLGRAVGAASVEDPVGAAVGPTQSALRHPVRSSSHLIWFHPRKSQTTSGSPFPHSLPHVGGRHRYGSPHSSQQKSRLARHPPSALSLPHLLVAPSQNSGHVPSHVIGPTGGAGLGAAVAGGGGGGGGGEGPPPSQPHRTLCSSISARLIPLVRRYRAGLRQKSWHVDGRHWHVPPSAARQFRIRTRQAKSHVPAGLGRRQKSSPQPASAHVAAADDDDDDDDDARCSMRWTKTLSAAAAFSAPMAEAASSSRARQRRDGGGGGIGGREAASVLILVLLFLVAIPPSMAPRAGKLGSGSIWNGPVGWWLRFRCSFQAVCCLVSSAWREPGMPGSAANLEFFRSVPHFTAASREFPRSAVLPLSKTNKY